MTTRPYPDISLTRTDATVNFDWGRGWGCHRHQVPRNYRFRYLFDSLDRRSGAGILARPTPSMLTPTTASRLWVNGQLIIDHWANGSGENIGYHRTYSRPKICYQDGVLRKHGLCPCQALLVQSEPAQTDYPNQSALLPGSDCHPDQPAHLPGPNAYEPGDPEVLASYEYDMLGGPPSLPTATARSSSTNMASLG